jgi:rhodanese-related sulfurtransferase
MKAEELKRKLGQGEKLELIDVREKEEFESGVKVPGSKNVPMGQVFVDASSGKIPKDKKIVTICKSGGRCEIVARELGKKGYNIDYLEGGIEAWKGVSDSNKSAGRPKSP